MTDEMEMDYVYELKCLKDAAFSGDEELHIKAKEVSDRIPGLKLPEEAKPFLSFSECDIDALNWMLSFGGNLPGVPQVVKRGDNCLFNAVSLAIYGNENKAPELRLRTCIEMIKHEMSYKKLTLRKNLEEFKSDFINEVRDCATGKRSGIWTVMALSTVTNAKIETYCPVASYVDDTRVNALNRTVLPRTGITRFLVKLLWTSKSFLKERTSWTLDHITYLSVISLAQENKRAWNYFLSRCPLIMTDSSGEKRRLGPGKVQEYGIPYSVSKWNFQMMTRYIKYPEHIGQLDLDDMKVEDIDAILNTLAEDDKKTRDLLPSNLKESEIKVYLENVLKHLFRKMSVQFKKEVSVDLPGVPRCVFDYVVYTTEDLPIGCVEAKSPEKFNIGSIAIAIVELIVLQKKAEICNKMNTDEIPLFNILTDGEHYCLMQIKGKKLYLENPDGEFRCRTYPSYLYGTNYNAESFKELFISLCTLIKSSTHALNQYPGKVIPTQHPDIWRWGCPLKSFDFLH